MFDLKNNKSEVKACKQVIDIQLLNYNIITSLGKFHERKRKLFCPVCNWEVRYTVKSK